MPTPQPRDEVMRTMIAAANARYNHIFGLSWTDAQIDALLARDFPFETAERRTAARDLAAQMSAGAQSYQHKIAHAAQQKKIVPSQPIESYLGGVKPEAGVVGITFYWVGKDGAGNNIHGSVVLNVPAGTKDSTVEARGCAYVLWLYGGRGSTYGLRSIGDCGVATFTPYSRHGGYDLDVAPITRTHPNPYPAP